MKNFLIQNSAYFYYLELKLYLEMENEMEVVHVCACGQCGGIILKDKGIYYFTSYEAPLQKVELLADGERINGEYSIGKSCIKFLLGAGIKIS